MAHPYSGIDGLVKLHPHMEHAHHIWQRISSINCRVRLGIYFQNKSHSQKEALKFGLMFDTWDDMTQKDMSHNEDEWNFR